MKKSFLTGLMLILPIVITVALVYFMFNMVTKPFIGPIESFLLTTNFFGYSEYHQFYLPLVTRIIVFIFLFLIITFIGLLVKIYWVHFFVHLGEKLIDSIPIVNKIYRASRDVVKVVFSQNDSDFKFGKVVLVPYPYKGMKSLGFLSNESFGDITEKGNLDYVSVLVPGSPNPTLGFLLLFRRDEIEYLDITPEEGLKFIISLGVVVDEKSFLTRVNDGS